MALLLPTAVGSVACPSVEPAPADDDDVGPPAVDCTGAAWTGGWERMGDGPVLEPRGWEGTIIRPTSVVPTDDGLRLFYLSASMEPCATGQCLARIVGLAAGVDGTSWERVGDGPVIDRWDDEVDVSHGVAARDGDGWTYRYGRAEGGTRMGIAEATSGDGLEWAVPDGEVLLGLGEPGSWSERYVGAPAAPVGEADRFWYTGSDGDTTGIGLATRTGDAWTSQGRVLGPGADGTHDEAGASNASIVDVEGCLVMGYKATSFLEAPADETVGVAVSLDGTTWERTSSPALIIQEEYELDGVVDPALWVDGEYVWMVYAALDADFVNTIALARREIPRVP